MNKNFKVAPNKFIPYDVGFFLREESTQPGGIVGGVNFLTGEQFGRPQIADWLIVSPKKHEEMKAERDGKNGSNSRIIN